MLSPENETSPTTEAVGRAAGGSAGKSIYLLISLLVLLLDQLSKSLIEATGVECGRAPDDAVDIVSFRQEKLGKV